MAWADHRHWQLLETLTMDLGVDRCWCDGCDVDGGVGVGVSIDVDVDVCVVLVWWR